MRVRLCFSWELIAVSSGRITFKETRISMTAEIKTGLPSAGDDVLLSCDVTVESEIQPRILVISRNAFEKVRPRARDHDVVE